MRAFRFRNRGNTAVIGRHAAVFDFGSWRLTGWFAWILWAIVHVFLLVGFENRVLVTMHWVWRYITFQRGARLITPVPAAEPAAEPPAEAPPARRPVEATRRLH
jgi:NADH dehydrogenase